MAGDRQDDEVSDGRRVHVGADRRVLAGGGLLGTRSPAERDRVARVRKAFAERAPGLPAPMLPRFIDRRAGAGAGASPSQAASPSDGLCATPIAFRSTPVAYEAAAGDGEETHGVYDRYLTLELRHLRYFVAVAEELNFSRAAERLHMAQPPLSAAIRQLEQELGTQLLLRTTREVRLTDAGRTFLAGARRTLAELARARGDAQRAGVAELGRVRVAFSWSARFQTLPAIGAAFRASHPDVALLTEEMWNARMLPALRSSTIDVALSLCPEIASEFSYETIRSESLVALLATTHPLAGEPALELKALENDHFLLFPRELAPRLYDFMVGLCRRAGFEPVSRSVSFHSGWDLEILRDVAGVALAPASVARDLPDGVAAVHVASPPDQVETALVWRTDDPSTANVYASNDGPELEPHPCRRVGRVRARGAGRRSGWACVAAA
jgi:DNA-binding transcriptional LysR family regulator